MKTTKATRSKHSKTSDTEGNVMFVKMNIVRPLRATVLSAYTVTSLVWLVKQIFPAHARNIWRTIKRIIIIIIIILIYPQQNLKLKG